MSRYYINQVKESLIHLLMALDAHARDDEKAIRKHLEEANNAVGNPFREGYGGWDRVEEIGGEFIKTIEEYK